MKTFTEQAIKKAISGGYDCKEDMDMGCYAVGGGLMSESAIFLDPSFWQSLGKGLEWTVQLIDHGNWDDLETMTTEETEKWKYEWHHFINHLISGHDAESFFTSLLK